MFFSTHAAQAYTAAVVLCSAAWPVCQVDWHCARGTVAYNLPTLIIWPNNLPIDKSLQQWNHQAL